MNRMLGLVGAISGPSVLAIELLIVAIPRLRAAGYLADYPVTLVQLELTGLPAGLTEWHPFRGRTTPESIMGLSTCKFIRRYRSAVAPHGSHQHGRRDCCQVARCCPSQGRMTECATMTWHPQDSGPSIRGRGGAIPCWVGRGGQHMARENAPDLSMVRIPMELVLDGSSPRIPVKGAA